MNAVFLGIKWVFNTCVTGLKVVVKDKYVVALVNVEYGHTVDRSTFCLSCSRVKNVVSANYDSGVSLLEVVVNVVHFKQIFVFDVSLAKQNVHVTRHTTCNRVNGVSNFSTVSGKFVSELFDKMLSLSNSHTVTGYDNYVFCVE